MGAIEIVTGIIMLIVSIGIIVLVALQQSSKQGGLSALTGGDSFYSKNQGRTKDAMLVSATRILGTIFLVVSVVVYAVLSRVG